MAFTRLRFDGRVTIPKPLRHAAGLREGDPHPRARTNRPDALIARLVTASAGGKQIPRLPLALVSQRQRTLVVMRARRQRVGRRAQQPGYRCLVAALRNDGPATWASR